MSRRRRSRGRLVIPSLKPLESRRVHDGTGRLEHARLDKARGRLLRSHGSRGGEDTRWLQVTRSDEITSGWVVQEKAEGSNEGDDLPTGHDQGEGCGNGGKVKEEEGGGSQSQDRSR